MLPHRALTNIDLMKFIKKLEIPHFRGVFMRDELPKSISSVECGIVNLDSGNRAGSHWTAYAKKNNSINYFDSIGNLRPPNELVNYFYSNGNLNKITYNHKREQNPDDFNCGHLCLEFLYKNMKRRKTIKC